MVSSPVKANGYDKHTSKESNRTRIPTYTYFSNQAPVISSASGAIGPRCTKLECHVTEQQRRQAVSRP
ncbi:hypothetical protein Bca4012_012722 [Brassica carinata]|uniref:Uncharacterized protein n=1 Tax=Brassica carinata TaxID=52824 RepID=A0A8X7Q467_BRACI|nr:hypothetical protein Bca52824_095927 [Brassica carinata]KAG2262673.1 hypothetical protein Bca52824_069752 [Brassica carinata]